MFRPVLSLLIAALLALAPASATERTSLPLAALLLDPATPAALDTASPQEVAALSETILQPDAVAPTLRILTASDTAQAHQVLFHPALLSHIVTADVTQIITWDRLAAGLRAKFGETQTAELGQ